MEQGWEMNREINNQLINSQGIIEAIPSKSNDHQVVVKFLHENIFTRFDKESTLCVFDKEVRDET